MNYITNLTYLQRAQLHQDVNLSADGFMQLHHDVNLPVESFSLIMMSTSVTCSEFQLQHKVNQHA